MIIKKDFAWVRYAIEDSHFDENKVGKWMYFFDNNPESIDFVEKISKEAISRGIVQACKHSNLNGMFGPRQGVACFYIHGDDNIAHRRVIAYFLEKNLIRKTPKGRLYNISFKYDKQTLSGEYGSEFVGEIKLDRFIDLDTGKWLTEN